MFKTSKSAELASKLLITSIDVCLIQERWYYKLKHIFKKSETLIQRNAKRAVKLDMYRSIDTPIVRRLAKT